VTFGKDSKSVSVTLMLKFEIIYLYIDHKKIAWVRYLQYNEENRETRTTQIDDVYL